LTEIEVTDPVHPVFGHRFTLLSVSSSPQSSGNVLVAYREYMALRIPLVATNLASVRPAGSTKLTLSALTQLISLAEHCEGLCHIDPPTAVLDYGQSSRPKSSTI
jgi:hypothetical protein